MRNHHVVLGTPDHFRGWIRRYEDTVHGRFDSVHRGGQWARLGSQIYRLVTEEHQVYGTGPIVGVRVIPGWDRLDPRVYEALAYYMSRSASSFEAFLMNCDLSTQYAFDIMRGRLLRHVSPRTASNAVLLVRAYETFPNFNVHSDRSDFVDASAFAYQQVASRMRVPPALLRAGERMTVEQIERIRRRHRRTLPSEFRQEYHSQPEPPNEPPPVDRHRQNYRAAIERDFQHGSGDSAVVCPGGVSEALGSTREHGALLLYHAEHREDGEVSAAEPVAEAREFTQEVLAQMQLECLQPKEMMLTTVWSPQEAMRKVIDLDTGGKYACLQYKAARGDCSQHMPSIEMVIPVTAIFRRS